VENTASILIKLRLAGVASIAAGAMVLIALR
jgi:hypothetical protein